MSARCARPAPWETLVAYWANDLSEHDADALELHAMGCDACSAALERVGAVTEAMRGLIAPIVTARVVQALRDKGMRVRENVFAPGERREVAFGDDTDVLLHRLTGLDLTQATRVSFVLRDEKNLDRVLIALDDAPFDRDAGSVLVACQKHYAFMPHDTVAEVRTRDAAGRESTATYTILHRYG